MSDPNPSERLAEIEARVEAATAKREVTGAIQFAKVDIEAHAREDIPWLLEQVREEREQSEQWKQGMIEQSAKRHVAEQENERLLEQLREARERLELHEPSIDWKRDFPTPKGLGISETGKRKP